MINLNKTEVVCPNCGAEFEISLTATEKSVGKTKTNSKSNKTSTKQMKASEKIAALAAAGVNVSNLFSMAGITGEEKIARADNGKLVIVPDDDPVFAAIMNDGTIPNNRLFRRWVMAQVFHMMAYEPLDRWRPKGFTAALNAKGFKYSWRMAVEEFRVQARLEIKDPENFIERNRWFNKITAMKMCESYLQELGVHIKQLKKSKIKHCKGIEYIHLRKRDVFVSDIETKVLCPLLEAYSVIERSYSAPMLYYGMSSFFEEIQRCWFEHEIPLSQAYKDAYKGAGAYYTMKNLILFHKAAFRNGNIRLCKEKSLAMLESKAEEYRNEGWRLFGLMKQFIEDNNIDIVKKMREWKKK